MQVWAITNCIQQTLERFVTNTVSTDNIDIIESTSSLQTTKSFIHTCLIVAFKIEPTTYKLYLTEITEVNSNSKWYTTMVQIILLKSYVVYSITALNGKHIHRMMNEWNWWAHNSFILWSTIAAYTFLAVNVYIKTKTFQIVSVLSLLS